MGSGLDAGTPTRGAPYPPANPSQIVFDSAGNLYWHSQSGGDDDHIASCTPDGVLRWLGPPEGIGHWQTDTTPVVGVDRVYIIGMFPTDDPANQNPDPEGDPLECHQYVYAVNKADGSLAWRTLLDNEPTCTDPPSAQSNNAQPNPMLYNGKLYVMGKRGDHGWPTGTCCALYQINAATGVVEINTGFSQISGPMCGNTLLVPNKFGTGIHGLYVLTYDTAPSQIFAFQVDTNTNVATFVWESSDEPGLALGDLWWGVARPPDVQHAAGPHRRLHREQRLRLRGLHIQSRHWVIWVGRAMPGTRVTRAGTRMARSASTAPLFTPARGMAASSSTRSVPPVTWPTTV